MCPSVCHMPVYGGIVPKRLNKRRITQTTPRNSPGTLVFWRQQSLVGNASFPLKFGLKVTHPLSNTTISKPISAHSTSTVRASEKCSISINSKLPTRFPTSYRWTVYVTPKYPRRVTWNAILLFLPVKFNFWTYELKKSAAKFLCVKTSRGKDVGLTTSFLYLTVHRWIAGDVPIYLKFALKVTHFFRKHVISIYFA